LIKPSSKRSLLIPVDEVITLLGCLKVVWQYMVVALIASHSCKKLLMGNTY